MDSVKICLCLVLYYWTINNGCTLVHTLYNICSTWFLNNINLFVFQLVSQGNITEYQVYYGGTTMNINSLTTTLTFAAPSLPDGVFTGTVVAMVSAVNRYGVGPSSDETAVIQGKPSNLNLLL